MENRAENNAIGKTIFLLLIISPFFRGSTFIGPAHFYLPFRFLFSDPVQKTDHSLVGLNGLNRIVCFCKLFLALARFRARRPRIYIILHINLVQNTIGLNAYRPVLPGSPMTNPIDYTVLIIYKNKLRKNETHFQPLRINARSYD